MSKDEIILPYKLEQHLIEICNNDATYANLLSVWNINKKMCQDVLSTVVMNYPHYTKHDISHFEAIITNIEMLLGEDAIKALSPTDTWLLLHAAYLHDIGMVIECNKIEKNWESKEFQNYLQESENSNDDELAQNARFINSFGDKLSKKDDVMSWPVQVRHAVTLLIAEYYRREHSEDSKSYIKNMESVFHIDLGFNGLIQQRLILLLADIVCLHTKSNEMVLDLDYRTNGFNADYVHPRFLAQMLRMGDLLDADNNRFNTANETVFGQIPESSKNHWEKHMSARHILITPDVIEYRADCSKPEVYRETRFFLSWLKEEIEFWTLNWKNIMPENIKGSAPRLGTCELLLNGVPDIQGLSDLRFNISSEKAFEVIEGANIYDDKFIFFREVIQNALDACKIQLWRDILENRYKAWIEQNDKSKIQPFDIAHEIYKNYDVQVILRNYNDTHFKIIIKDNGIGLSAEQFKKICDVGTSYLGDKNRKNEVDSMPLWLRPTAGFGIGLQSIFLVTDEFEIYSKSSGNEGIYARISSGRKNGYVQISASDKLKCQGTEIHIVFPRVPRDFDFESSLFGNNTSNYIRRNYDPFTEEKILLYYKIWDVFRGTMLNTYFPIQLYFEDKLVDKIEPQQFQKLENYSKKKRYRYIINSDYSMELWDSNTCTKMKIYLQNTYDKYCNNYYFKGMETNDPYLIISKGVRYKVDFYGLDTRKTLSLDRKNIKKEALEQIQEILDSAMDFYIETIEEPLFANKTERTEIEYNKIYTYWCMCSLKMKAKLLEKYSKIFENVTFDVNVLQKNGSKYENTKIDFKEVISDLDNMVTIKNLSTFFEDKPFVGNNGLFSLNIELIKNILDTQGVKFPIVVVDTNFTEMLDVPYSKKIAVVSTGDAYNMYLTVHSIQEDKLPHAFDDKSKKILLSSMFKKNNTMHRNDLASPSMRRYSIGIAEYEVICTARVPLSIDMKLYPSIGYLIAPFTIEQWENNKHLPIDEFEKIVCESKEFQNLINYTFENQIKSGSHSKEDIRETYIDLVRELYDVANENVK